MDNIKGKDRDMSTRKIHSPETIIAKLRKAEVMIHAGKTIEEVCRHMGITDSTYYKWRKEYGGMQVSQAKRMKELEKENNRLKRAVADLTLDKLILQDVAAGK